MHMISCMTSSYASYEMCSWYHIYDIEYDIVDNIVYMTSYTHDIIHEFIYIWSCCHILSYHRVPRFQIVTVGSSRGPGEGRPRVLTVTQISIVVRAQADWLQVFNLTWSILNLNSSTVQLEDMTMLSCKHSDRNLISHWRYHHYLKSHNLTNI